MHYIQQKILYVLALTDKARFSQLKPQEIESNLFIYHLRQLMRDKLAVKNADGTYSLSAEGKAYADRINWKTLKPRSQPKIVNLIACRNDRGEYLFYRRKHHPFIGLAGFPYGKIHLGETIKESSERELLEKTNLHAKLTHRGDVYQTIFDGDTLIVHTLFHIHTGTSPEGKLKEETPIGYCYWAKVDRGHPEQYFPGFLDVLKLIESQSKQRFFAEYTYHI